jgi:DNA modification methylase
MEVFMKRKNEFDSHIGLIKEFNLPLQYIEKTKPQLSAHILGARKEKPVELIEELVCATTNEGDTVVDPFMGSGATAKACKKSNRRYIGFEIDRQWCERAVNDLKSPI